MLMFDRINAQWDQALEHKHAPELAAALQQQQRECQVREDEMPHPAPTHATDASSLSPVDPASRSFFFFLFLP